MGIEIILYDSSPITQKIFSHILYHYHPKVHRVDEATDLMEKILHSKPDIIFIDKVFSEKHTEDQLSNLKDVPIIFIGQEALSETELEKSLAEDFLKKPIEAGKLKDVIKRFVPKTKTNILDKYLKFPKLPEMTEEKLQDSTILEEEEEEEGFGISKTSSLKEDPPYSVEKTEDGIRPVTDTAIKEIPANKTTEPQKENTEGVKPATGIKLATDTAIKEIPTNKTTEPQKENTEGVKPATGIKLATDTAIKEIPTNKTTEPQKENTEGVKPATGIKLATDTAIKEEEDLFKETSKKPILSTTEEPFIKSLKKENNTSSENLNLDSDSIVDEVADPPLHRAPTTRTINQAFFGETVSKPEQDVNFQKASSKSDPNIEKIKKELSEEIRVQAEKMNLEMEERLRYFKEINTPEIIQKEVEKTVTKMLPEIAKNLITKKLNELLEEEEE